jgi:hypothetical protein
LKSAYSNHFASFFLLRHLSFQNETVVDGISNDSYFYSDASMENGLSEIALRKPANPCIYWSKWTCIYIDLKFWQSNYLLIKCTAVDFGAVQLLTIPSPAHLLLTIPVP